MIFYTGNTFDAVKTNPYDRNMPYTKQWIFLRLKEDDTFFHYTGGGTDGVFHLVITKNNADWRFRVMDFLHYENDMGKNVIAAIQANDLEEAVHAYQNHAYTDKFLRSYEQPVLIHSTTKENYQKICENGCLKSWKQLKQTGKTAENKPIGALLGDPDDYSDYVMLQHGILQGNCSAEIVVSSKQKGYIDTNPDAEYTAGARMYFYALKIAADGYLIRDGAHWKVKDVLSMRYLIWAATPETLGISEKTTPRTFAALADFTFQTKFTDFID